MQTMVRRRQRILLAAATYFGGVFAIGFCLGVPRTLLLEPRIGDMPAVAIELPLLLMVAWWICARVLRRQPLSPGDGLPMGALAFALLMLAETSLSLWLAGRSLAEHLALYSQPAHQLGLTGQLLFALFPWLQLRQGR